MNTSQFLAGVLLSLAGVAASAQTAAPGANTPRVDQRQANPAQRIDHGVASGALIKRETRRLERQQAVIDKAENKAKADGGVTAQERKRLTHLQNHASRDIRRQKHDRQVAGGAGKQAARAGPPQAGDAPTATRGPVPAQGADAAGVLGVG